MHHAAALLLPALSDAPSSAFPPRTRNPSRRFCAARLCVCVCADLYGLGARGGGGALASLR